MATMSVAVIQKPGEVAIEQRPMPTAGPGQVVLKVAACGVCGTDVHIFHGEFRGAYPMIPGHEYSGTVVEVGEGVFNVKPGDHVVIDPNIACGACRYCRHGLIHLCEHLTALGVDIPGGFAEYNLAPATQVYKIPDTLSLKHAAMVEPIACCLHGIDRAQIQSGDSVLILGAGPIGLIMTQLAKVAGAAQVMVSEPAAGKRLRAEQLGASATFDPSKCDLAEEVKKRTEIGADVVIECVGRPETSAQTVKTARRGGRIVLFGVNLKDTVVPFKPFDIYMDELSISAATSTPTRTSARWTC